MKEYIGEIIVGGATIIAALIGLFAVNARKKKNRQTIKNVTGSHINQAAHDINTK